MERAEISFLPEELANLIAAKDWRQLARMRSEWPDPEIMAPDVVQLLGHFEKIDRVLFFRALPKELSIEVFASLEGEDQEELLHDLTDTETRRILAEMSPDDRTALLEELSGPIVQRLLNLLSPEDLAETRELLGYPERSVGRLMSPDYLSVRPDWDFAHCLRHFQKYGKDSDSMNIVYVTDKAGKLIDALPLWAFVTGKPESIVRDVMDESFVKVSAYEDQEEAVRLMTKYARIVLPVVDSNDILLGIVTVDDVLEVAEEETTEDFQRVAAISPLGRSYWDTSVWRLFKSRIVWLAILVLVNLISSGVIGAFEHVLSTYVVLAGFIPLLIGTGGNAGSQSSTMMIRAISTGDVRLGQWGRVFLKELGLGLILGIILGLLGMAIGVLRGGWEIGLVVFFSLSAILLVTNILGMLLPFLLTKLNLDPAIASGPLVTTIADAAGLLIYFALASALLAL